MLCGVRHRLAGREHEHACPVVERSVARAHDLDADAVELLDLGGRCLDRIGEGSLGRRLAVGVEPRAKLALLAAGERRDAPWVVRVALDQRERLQNGVVYPRSEVCALLRPDSLGTLGIALAAEPPRPWPEQEDESSSDGTGSKQRRRAAVAATTDEDRDAEDGEDDRRDARPPSIQPERGRARRERRTRADQRERPDERIREAEPAKGEDHRPDEQHGAGDPPLARGRRLARRGQQRPGAEVRNDARAAREGEHGEREAHERRIHCKCFADAAADAREHAVALHARDARERHR